MARVLVIGCGNVGSVGLRKMVQWPKVFSEIHVVARTVEKAYKVKQAVWGTFPGIFNIYQADVSSYESFIKILTLVKPDIVIHWGHPYDNLIIMDACMEFGVNYIDTACYEEREKYGFSHERQWLRGDAFENKQILALLGCGFDPGVTNVFCAHARDYIFDEVHTIDILDCNAGIKNVKFAPNFDPELNLRELILPVRFWQKGRWQERGRIFDFDAKCFPFKFPETEVISTPYLMYHEELESIVNHMPHLKRIRFWMTFSKEYLTYLRVLHNVGLTSIYPIMYEGKSIVPVKFLDELLPKGNDFNASYTGKTCIGCVISGLKNGKKITIYIYQVCDHREAFKETGGNAIGYTTAIPTVTAAKLILEGRWGSESYGVRNIEDPVFDSKIFLGELTKMGLPWKIIQLKAIPVHLRKSY